MKTIIAILASSAAAGLLMGACQPKAEVSQTPQPKPRTIVTCDPELDDNNSMVRFILHSTDFDIEGLVETSSQFHWSGDGKGTKYFHPGREYDRPGFNHGPMESYRWEADSVNFINRILDAYQECYPNLKVHDPSYPDPSYLKSISVVGNIDFEGEMDHDTEGSNLIRDRILADKPGELFLQAWGGTSSIARALKSIEDTYKGTPAWDSLVNVINSRVVLCMSGEQDDTYKDYIHPHWPGIHRMNVMGGGLGLAYNSQRRLRNPEDSVYYSAKWMADNQGRTSGDGLFRLVRSPAKGAVPRRRRRRLLHEHDRKRSACMAGRDLGRLGRKASRDAAGRRRRYHERTQETDVPGGHGLP